MMENQSAMEQNEERLADVEEAETMRVDLQPKGDLEEATESREEDECGQ